MAESSPEVDLPALRKALSKKVQFAPACAELTQAIRSHGCGSPAVWDVCKRASTVLTSRCTSTQAWSAGLLLFEAALEAAREEGDAAQASSAEGWCMACRAELAELVAGSAADATTNAAPEAEAAAGARGLEEQLRALAAGFPLQQGYIMEEAPRAGGAKKASREAVFNLPMVAPKGGKSEACAICQEEFGRAKAKQLPCGHGFHYDCLMPWLDKSNTCPTCRTPMRTTEEDETRRAEGYNDAPSAAVQSSPHLYG